MFFNDPSKSHLPLKSLAKNSLEKRVQRYVLFLYQQLLFHIFFEKNRVNNISRLLLRANNEIKLR